MTDYNKGSIQNFNTRGQVGERESGIPGSPVRVIVEVLSFSLVVQVVVLKNGTS